MGENRQMPASEANLHLIIEMSPDAVITLSEAGIILFANPAAEQMFEQPATAMIGSEFGFPVTGKETTEIEVLSASGELKTAEMRFVDIEWKGEKALLLTLRDITKKKASEQEVQLHLVRQKALLKLYRQMPDVSIDAMVNFVVKQCIHLTGSTLGFVGFINEDQAFMTTHFWSENPVEECQVDKPSVFPLEKAGLWAEVIRQGVPITVNDYDLPNLLKKGYPAGHVPLTRFAGVPILEDNRVVAIASVANKKSPYAESDTLHLSLLMGGLWDLIKRKRTEDALRASEIGYRRLFEAAKDGILIVNTETGIILDVNPFMVELLGYNREEFLGKTIWDLGFFADIVASKDNFLELQAKGYVRYEDLPLQTADGRQIDVEFVSNVYAVNSHTVIQCNIRDITERKQATEALHERVKELGCINTLSRLANEPLISIEEFVRQAVGILPSGWRHPEVCAARIMLGSTEFKTTNFRETAWRQEVDILVDRKKFGTVTICYLEEKPPADEGPFLKEEKSLLDTIADLLGHIIQHRRSEEEISASEERFRIIFDSTHDGILLADPKGKKFHFANATLCRMLGYGQEEIKNIGVMDIHPEKDLPAVMEQFEKHSRNEISVTPALPVKRKDGSVFYADVHSSPVEISGKQYLLGVFRDITERQKLEDQLRQSQKMEAIGTLAGGIAHDFNNILNVIMGYGEMVMETLVADSPAKEDMLEVLTAAGRAANLTRRLLLFSRKEVAEMKPLDINELLRDLRKMLDRVIRESIELHLELADNPLIVLADTGMIEQVVMNLVSNAKDTMPEGGRLSIATCLKEMDEDYVAVNGYGKPGWYALITVSDTGGGMDAATRKRIFEPFFTTKEVGRGTGLGLSISYGIVKQHGGYIRVYSAPGQGTTFSIYLPLSEQRSSPDRTLAVVPVLDGNETILLAEDSESLRVLGQRVLQSFGYRVIIAEDGEEAIARYMENRESIDLLVLDMIMPKKNGKEIAEEIRRINPRIKVLFASGYPLDIITAKKFTVAGFAFIHKPYQSKELLIKVREVLDK